MITIFGKPIFIPGTADHIGGKRLSTKERIIASADKTLKKVIFFTSNFIKTPRLSPQRVYGANKQ